MLPDVGTGGNDELLIFAVDQFAHALDQQAFRVALEDGIPFAAPENFNYVPTCAAECRFKFLDDLAIAADGTIETLQIAVDDKYKIVELFARGERDCAERLGLIRFAVAKERPDFCIGLRLQSARFKIPGKAGLID